MTARTSLKIAYLGGGSHLWARALLRDPALFAHLDGELALFDLKAPAARKNVLVGEDIFARPEARSRLGVRAARTLANALLGADAAVISTEPGPVTKRHADLAIPARHGIRQAVGDTTAPGGLLHARRAIPDYLDFGAAIARHCPRAWVINYTNPMTPCTAALHVAFPGIRAFGCCHEVPGVRERLAADIARWLGVAARPREEIELDIAGLNHFTRATAVRWRGVELFPLLAQDAARPAALRNATALARKNRTREQWFESPGLVALDLFRRYGALGAAGERHLVEFLPEYLRDEPTLHRWGVVAPPYAWRLRHRQGPDESLAALRLQPLKPSGEEGVRLLEALTGHGRVVASVNLPNAGQMPGLPSGRSSKPTPVSAPARSRRSSRAGSRPPPNRACASSPGCQAQVLHAARTRDVSAACNALVADPLCARPIDDTWRIFAEMLAHVRAHLRGWKRPASPRSRLASFSDV